MSLARVAIMTLSIVALVSGMPPVAAQADDEPGFHLELVASDLGRPTYITAPPSDAYHLYLVGQRGVIRVFERAALDAPWVQAGSFLDMHLRVKGPFVGRGLLSMAFDPDYATNHKFYVFYTRRPDGAVAIAEYKATSALHAQVASRRVVLVIPYVSAYHFGGWIGFGPDGYMYMTTGDDTQSALPPSQDLASRQGKVLRFNAHRASGKSGFVPVDNPFVGGAKNDDLVWAYGTRNPWRASFDTTTGTLWLPDVGESRYEEINRFTPYGTGSGTNLGWPLCEGVHAYPEDVGGPAPCAVPNASAPLIEYPHAGGNCSVIGGYVYRGSAQTSLVGRYFFGDYCTGNIWAIPADYSSGELGTPLNSGLHINSFGTDGLGELYVIGHNGTVWHLVSD